MHLTVQNQLMLLHDLLDEQMKYTDISYEHYQQIKKLVQSIIKFHIADDDLLQILPEIYYFGIKGETASSLPAYVDENSENITNWLQTLRSASS